MRLFREGAAALVAAFVFASFFAPSPGSSLGVSCRSIVGQSAECVYVAVTTPTSIILAVVILLLWRFTQIQVPEDIDKPVAIYQRAVAFFIDMFVLMLCVLPVVTIFALSLEWLATGAWSWEVIRYEVEPVDTAISMAGVTAIFWMMVRVLSRCARAGRPSFGQLIAGYRVTAGDGRASPEYVTRVIFSLIGVTMLPISLVKALRNERRDFWWDAATNTKAVRSEPFP